MLISIYNDKRKKKHDFIQIDIYAFGKKILITDDYSF